MPRVDHDRTDGWVGWYHRCHIHRMGTNKHEMDVRSLQEVKKKRRLVGEEPHRAPVSPVVASPEIAPVRRDAALFSGDSAIHE